MYSDDSDSDGSYEAYNEKNRKNKTMRLSKGSAGHSLYNRLKAGTLSRGWMHAAVLSAFAVMLIVALRSNQHGHMSGDNVGNISMLDDGAPISQESDLQQSLRAQRKLFHDVVET